MSGKVITFGSIDGEGDWSTVHYVANTDEGFYVLML